MTIILLCAIGATTVTYFAYLKNAWLLVPCSLPWAFTMWGLGIMIWEGLVNVYGVKNE